MCSRAHFYLFLIMQRVNNETGGAAAAVLLQYVLQFAYELW